MVFVAPRARRACDQDHKMVDWSPKLTVPAKTLHVAYWQIVLQKSQKAQRLISRQRTKRATIADQQSIKPATTIAREFSA